MKKSILIVFYLILISCNGSKQLNKSIEVSCSNIYLFKDEEALTDYYYFVFNIKNLTSQDLVLKKNKFSKDKSYNDLKSLNLEFILNNKKLQSPFVEGQMMRTDFVLFKKKNTKVVYFLELNANEKFNKNIIISEINKTFIDTINFPGDVINLSNQMSIDDAGKLMGASFSG